MGPVGSRLSPVGPVVPGCADRRLLPAAPRWTLPTVTTAWTRVGATGARGCGRTRPGAPRDSAGRWQGGGGGPVAAPRPSPAARPPAALLGDCTRKGSVVSRANSIGSTSASSVPNTGGFWGWPPVIVSSIPHRGGFWGLSPSYCLLCPHHGWVLGSVPGLFPSSPCPLPGPMWREPGVPQGCPQAAPGVSPNCPGGRGRAVGGEGPA